MFTGTDRPPPHGTYRYKVFGCRCPLCQAAQTAACAAERERRRARLAADPSLAEHGTKATYSNWGCRCPQCTAANSAVSKAFRHRRRRRQQQEAA